jgi:hypothetical protein
MEGDMSQRHEVKVEQELHGLLDKAMGSADHETLARLHDLLLYMSEGADLLDYSFDIPDGLEHKPIFKRMLLSQQLLNEAPLGRA